MLNFGFGAFNFIPFEKKTRTFSFQLELSLVIISLFGAVFYGLSELPFSFYGSKK